VAGFCEHGDESFGSGAAELVSTLILILVPVMCVSWMVVSWSHLLQDPHMNLGRCNRLNRHGIS
jgi:hypothetical protein